MSEHRLTVYGASWCGDCRRAKKLLGEQRVPYAWTDITDNDEAIRFVESVNEGKRRIPTVLLDDGTVLSNPSNADLAEVLGLLTETIERDRFGFLKTSKTLETSMPGVFAAGDVRHGATAQRRRRPARARPWRSWSASTSRKCVIPTAPESP